MVILFGAGHVLGAKIYLGYNEDLNMFDLAKREAQYAAEKYGQETKTFYVTHTSYPAVEDACRGCDLAIFEHSDADDSIVEASEPNRVVIFRTVKNPGDGACRAIGLVAAKILNTYLADIQHAANSYGDDAYGVLGRAMKAGCKDTWLMENGFHTHNETRKLLSLPEVRQELAEAKVDAMAAYYGWVGEDDLKQGDKGADVKLWQNRLIQWNANALPRFKADGSFGGETVEWTKRFQSAMTLIASGIVDAQTWNAMVGALQGDSAKVASLETRIKALEAEVHAKAAIAMEASNKLKNARGAIDVLKLL